MQTRLCWAMAAAVLALAAPARAQSEADRRTINLPREVSGQIARCWAPPQTDGPYVLEVTVRLSFSRAGEVIGAPRVAFIKAPVGQGVRRLVAASILAAVKACTPLKFTPSLSAAIAGRIFAIRFISLPVTGKPQDI